MGTVFCIMGKSSTGKDTIYRELLDHKELNLNRIVTYTTRPIRGSEENGVEYYFTDETHEEELREAGKIIESRSYMTMHGRWDYFMADDGQVQKDRDYLIIATLESFVSIKEYYTDMTIEPIYIYVEDGIRLERALSRERRQPEPKYREMCRRYLADCEDFSEEKLAVAGVSDDHIFENHSVEETVAAIIAFIGRVRARRS